jgi:aminoglycoside phosphotransferase (APT) family kinase protein
MSPLLKKIAEGREAEIFAWEHGSVLRLMRDGSSHHELEGEAAAMRAAASAGVRVPIVHETITVEGRPGLVMERIDGVDLMSLVGKKPWLVFSIAAQSGSIHAALHDVFAPDALPPLRAALRRRIEQSELAPDGLARFALSVLETLPDGDRVCHGDYHLGNILKTEGGPVLIDWTSVTRGDPTADFARTNMMARLGDVPPGAPIVVRYSAFIGRGLFRWSYVRAYRSARPLDLRLAARWEIPIAAARLADGVEPERPKLIAHLERAQRQHRMERSRPPAER